VERNAESVDGIEIDRPSKERNLTAWSLAPCGDSRKLDAAEPDPRRTDSIKGKGKKKIQENADFVRRGNFASMGVKALQVGEKNKEKRSTRDERKSGTNERPD